MRTGRTTLFYPLYFHQQLMERSNMCIAHVACSLSVHAILLHTHICKHTQLDQKSWLGNEGKGHASINRCLADCFWRVFLALPLKSVGVLSAVVSLCLACKHIAILAAFIYHKHWSKRAQSLRDMGRGFKPAWSGSAFIHWVYDFTVPPCCCVVACDAVNPTSSANSL